LSWQPVSALRPFGIDQIAVPARPARERDRLSARLHALPDSE
jgi:hypothetical protein